MNKLQLVEWMDQQISRILEMPKDAWKKEFTLLQHYLKLKKLKYTMGGTFEKH